MVGERAKTAEYLPAKDPWQDSRQTAVSFRCVLVGNIPESKHHLSAVVVADAVTDARRSRAEWVYERGGFLERAKEGSREESSSE